MCMFTNLAIKNKKRDSRNFSARLVEAIFLVVGVEISRPFFLELTSGN